MLSPDGRWWWNGAAWVPAIGPPGTQSTAWTPPLQRASAALLSIQVVTMAVLIGVAELTQGPVLPPVSRSDSLRPAERANLELYQGLVNAVVHGVNLALGLFETAILAGLGAVLIAGCLLRWRWVFWFQMIAGIPAFAALILGTLGLSGVASSSAGAGIVPRWGYGVLMIESCLAVALSV